MSFHDVLVLLAVSRSMRIQVWEGKWPEGVKGRGTISSWSFCCCSCHQISRALFSTYKADTPDLRQWRPCCSKSHHWANYLCCCCCFGLAYRQPWLLGLFIKYSIIGLITQLDAMLSIRKYYLPWDIKQSSITYLLYLHSHVLFLFYWSHWGQSLELSCDPSFLAASLDSRTFNTLSHHFYRR